MRNKSKHLCGTRGIWCGDERCNNGKQVSVLKHRLKASLNDF